MCGRFAINGSGQYGFTTNGKTGHGPWVLTGTSQCGKRHGLSPPEGQLIHPSLPNRPASSRLPLFRYQTGIHLPVLFLLPRI